jgi:hypothetical protein
VRNITLPFSGQSGRKSTVRYLGNKVDDAIEIAKQWGIVALRLALVSGQTGLAATNDFRPEADFAIQR